MYTALTVENTDAVTMPLSRVHIMHCSPWCAFNDWYSKSSQLNVAANEFAASWS